MPIRTSTSKRLTCLSLVFALAGCGGQHHSLLQMAINHNTALDQIERNTTLLNLLRAADQQPLSFTTVSYLGGSGNLGGNVNFSESRSSYFKPVQALGTYFGLNVYEGFNYSLAALDNEQFTRAFVSSVPLDRIFLFQQSARLRQDVLWTLLVESVAYEDAQGERHTFPNTAKPTAWSQFQLLVSEATRLGLGMEEISEQVPVGPRLSRNEALNQLGTVVANWSSSIQPGAARPRLVETGDSHPDRTHQLVMTSHRVRFCFNPPSANDWPYSSIDLLCQSSPSRLAASKSEKPQQTASRSVIPNHMVWRDIKIRSPREVFYFLGEVVKQQLHEPSQAWVIGGTGVGSTKGGKPLLKVFCNSPLVPSDALAVASHRGQNCHVPNDEASYSAQVFQYLSLLASLSKIPSSLPTTPAVLIR